MKKNLGSVLGLYPTPLVIVGAMVEGKPNWVLVGHLGILGQDRIMVSLAKPHDTNKGMKEMEVLSINIASESLLEKADYVGCVSGMKTDKSMVFEYESGEEGAPVIKESPLVMEWKIAMISMGLITLF